MTTNVAVCRGVFPDDLDNLLDGTGRSSASSKSAGGRGLQVMCLADAAVIS